jgi:hypothetical protein
MCTACTPSQQYWIATTQRIAKSIFDKNNTTAPEKGDEAAAKSTTAQKTSQYRHVAYLTGFEVCAAQVTIHSDVAVHLGVLFHQCWIRDVFKAVAKRKREHPKHTEQRHQHIRRALPILTNKEQGQQQIRARGRSRTHRSPNT